MKAKKTKPIELVDKRKIEEVKKRIKKRSVGERADIYFDSIDLQILTFLNKRNPASYKDNDYSHYYYDIPELIKGLNIPYKNLKPHLDKLRNLKLVEVFTTIENGTAVFTTPKLAFEYCKDECIYDNEENTKLYEKDKLKAEYFESVLSTLHNVSEFFYEKEKDKALNEFDLRTNKTRDKLKKI
jgi:hypothetical protein